MSRQEKGLTVASRLLKKTAQLLGDGEIEQLQPVRIFNASDVERHSRSYKAAAAWAASLFLPSLRMSSQ